MSTLKMSNSMMKMALKKEANMDEKNPLRLVFEIQPKKIRKTYNKYKTNKKTLMMTQLNNKKGLS
jgi:hypothetical protein